jgi:hypothetical protein
MGNTCGFFGERRDVQPSPLPPPSEEYQAHYSQARPFNRESITIVTMHESGPPPRHWGPARIALHDRAQRGTAAVHFFFCIFSFFFSPPCVGGPFATPERGPQVGLDGNGILPAFHNLRKMQRLLGSVGERGALLRAVGGVAARKVYASCQTKWGHRLSLADASTPFRCCTACQVSVLRCLLNPEPGLTLCLGAASGGVVPSSCLGPSWVPILTFWSHKRTRARQEGKCSTHVFGPVSGL